MREPPIFRATDGTDIEEGKEGERHEDQADQRRSGRDGARRTVVRGSAPVQSLGVEWDEPRLRRQKLVRAAAQTHDGLPLWGCFRTVGVNRVRHQPHEWVQGDLEHTHYFCDGAE